MDKCAKFVKIVSFVVIAVSFVKGIKEVIKSFMVISGCTKLLKAIK